MGFLAQNLYTGGVKSAYLEIPGCWPHQLFQALPHLLGGLVGKGDRQYPFRLYPPFFYEVGHPVGQNPGFAAAGTCQDQKGGTEVLYRLPLGVVQARKQFLQYLHAPEILVYYSPYRKKTLPPPLSYSSI